jgi:hypothetical protein
MNQFIINGAVPVTQQQMDQRFNHILEMMTRGFTELRQRQEQLPIDDQIEGEGNLPDDPVIEMNYDTWNWGGRLLQPVPETYRLPRPTSKQLWDMWFFGLRIKWEDRDRKIRPLRWFKQYNLKNKSDQKLLCKGRVFITKLLDLAVTIGVIVNAESVNQMNYNQSTTIFDAAFDCMLLAIEAAYFDAQIERFGDRRVGELHFVTIYNDMKTLSI